MKTYCVLAVLLLTMSHASGMPGLIPATTSHSTLLEFKTETVECEPVLCDACGKRLNGETTIRPVNDPLVFPSKYNCWPENTITIHAENHPYQICIPCFLKPFGIKEVK